MHSRELPQIRSSFDVLSPPHPLFQAMPTGLWLPRTVWAATGDRKLATLETFAPSTCQLSKGSNSPSGHKDCDVLQRNKTVFSPPIFDDGSSTNNIKIEYDAGTNHDVNVAQQQHQQILLDTSVPYIKQEEGVELPNIDTVNSLQQLQQRQHYNMGPSGYAPIQDTERRPLLPREILETLQSLAGVRLSELRMTGFHLPQATPGMVPQIPASTSINIAPAVAPMPQWPNNNNWNCQPSWRGGASTNPAEYWVRSRREIRAPEETGQQPKLLTLDELKFRGLLRHIPMGGTESNGDAISQNRRDSKRNSFLKKQITPLVCSLIEEGYDIRLGEKGRTRLKKEISLRFRVHAHLRESCHKHVCRLKNANVIQLLAMSEITGCLPRCLEIANDYWRAYGARRVDPFVDSAGSALKQNSRRGRKPGDDSILKRKRGRPRHFSQPDDSNNNRQAKRARTESEEEVAGRQDNLNNVALPPSSTMVPIQPHVMAGGYNHVEIKMEDNALSHSNSLPAADVVGTVNIKIEEHLDLEMPPIRDAPSDGLQSLEGLLELNSSRIKG